MTFELSLTEKFQVEKFKSEMQQATKEQLIELVIKLYEQDKRKTKFFVHQLKIMSDEIMKLKT